MDLERALKTAISTGDVKLGAKESLKAVKGGYAKLLILAANCPGSEEISSLSSEKGIPVKKIDIPGTELGTLCGRPFAVSALAIIEPGSSDIISILRQ